MDYDKFKREYNAFEEWQADKEWESLDKDTFKASDAWKFPKMNMYDQASLKDGKKWLRIVEGYDRDNEWSESVNNLVDRVNSGPVGPVDNDGNFYHPETQNDMVNSPAHYTRGSQECIDTIEEAIQDAPNPITGSLQYQVLKYILRMWLKGNALRDAEKARWYLNRLISKLEDNK